MVLRGERISNDPDLLDNLQTWYENDCDTRLLHSNLSFPLLKLLAAADDYKAKRVFKEEIAKTLLGTYIPTKRFLIEENYLSYLSVEEIDSFLVEYEELIDNLGDIEKIEKETRIFIFIKLKYSKHRINEDIEEIYKSLVVSDKEIRKPEIWYKYSLLCTQFYDEDLANYCLKKCYEIVYKTYKKLKRADIKGLVEDWYELGIACEKCHQYELALECFLEIIKCNHKYKYTWAHLGNNYKELGDENKAIKAYKQALILNPQNSEIPIILAYIYLELDKVDVLIKLCKKVLKLNPKNAELWYLLSMAYKSYSDGLNKDKGDIDKAIKCSLEALKIEATNPFVIQQIIELYYHKIDYNKSQKYCLDALKINPSDSKALDFLSEIYLLKGEREKAILICKKAINYSFTFSSNWFRLGKVYFNLKKYNKAVESFNKVLKLDRNDIKAWNYLENCYLVLGDKIKASIAKANKVYYYDQFQNSFNNIISNK